MKIIIAGDGKVGLTLTQKLSSEGHDLTLIDSNQEVLDSSVERYDVMGVQGNCASMRVLERADVQKADFYHEGCLLAFTYGESGEAGGT